MLSKLFAKPKPKTIVQAQGIYESDRKSPGTIVGPTYDVGKFENQLLGKYGKTAQNDALLYIKTSPMTDAMLMGAASCRERCRAMAHRGKLRHLSAVAQGDQEEAAKLKQYYERLASLSDQVDKSL